MSEPIDPSSISDAKLTDSEKLAIVEFVWKMLLPVITLVTVGSGIVGYSFHNAIVESERANARLEAKQEIKDLEVQLRSKEKAMEVIEASIRDSAIKVEESRKSADKSAKSLSVLLSEKGFVEKLAATEEAKAVFKGAIQENLENLSIRVGDIARENRLQNDELEKFREIADSSELHALLKVTNGSKLFGVTKSSRGDDVVFFSNVHVFGRVTADNDIVTRTQVYSETPDSMLLKKR